MCVHVNMWLNSECATYPCNMVKKFLLPVIFEELIMDALKHRMPDNFSHLTPQKCSRVFFLQHVSAEMETMKGQNKKK